MVNLCLSMGLRGSVAMGDENIHVAIVIVLLIILICVGMQRYGQVEVEEFGGRGGFRGGGRGGFRGAYRGGFRGAHRGGFRGAHVVPRYYGGYGRRFRPGYVGPAYYDSPWYYSWLPWNDTGVPNYENSVVSVKQIEIRPDGQSVSVELDNNGAWSRFVGGRLDSEGQIGSVRASSILKLAEVEPEDNTDSTLTVIIVYASGNSTAKTVARSVMPDDLRI